MQTVLIDFTQPVRDFSLVTDSSERELGKSHGTLTYKDSIRNKSSYFFANLAPQPNGAAFVSVIIPNKVSLNATDTLCLRAQGLQNAPAVFQVLLVTNASRQEHFSFQQKFTIGSTLQEIRLPVADFKAYYRGRAYPDAPEIEPSDIQAIGIRIIGRDKNPAGENQQGLFGLEMYELGVCG